MDAGSKIVFTVTNDLNFDQRMQRICTSLSKAGYEVVLIGRRKKSSGLLHKQPYRQIRLNPLFQNGKLFYAIYNCMLFFRILFIKADAYCAIDLDTALPLVLVSGIKRKKLIYDAHEYFTEVPELMNRRSVQKFWLWVEKLLIPRTHARYTVSQGLADLYMDKYQKRFDVIRNVTVQASAGDINERNPKMLIYQGAVNEGRGLEAMIHCMKDHNWELHIAGEGDLLEEINELAASTGNREKVIFHGWLSPTELKKLTKEAYVGINLLENKGLSYYHSLSNKFFDYMQVGLPQVFIGFPEYLAVNKEYEIGIPVNDLEPAKLSAAIENLLNDTDLYRKLVQNCKEASGKFNWEIEEKKLLDIYLDL